MKNVKVIYDIQSCPDGLNMKQIIDISNNLKFVIYDSTLGNKPKVLDESLEILEFNVPETKKLIEKYKPK